MRGTDMGINTDILEYYNTELQRVVDFGYSSGNNKIRFYIYYDSGRWEIDRYAYYNVIIDKSGIETNRVDSIFENVRKAAVETLFSAMRDSI